MRQGTIVYAEGFTYGMKVHAGVDKDSGLIHSVVVTAVADLLHGDEEVVYGDAGYQGIVKRPEMAGKIMEFRVAMRPGNAESYRTQQRENCRIWLRRLKLTSAPRSIIISG